MHHSMLALFISFTISYILRDIFFDLEQKYCAVKKIIFQRENFNYSIVFFHSVYPVYTKSWVSIADLFAMRYQWVVCNEDKCCVMTQRVADIAWLVYVRTYCVPIATLNQDKRTRLLYLGDAQIIMTFLLPTLSSFLKSSIVYHYVVVQTNIRHLHISHNAPNLPPKFCISIFFNFSWDGRNNQEK